VFKSAGAIPIPGMRRFTGSVWQVSRATLEKNPHEVASMFDGVARRYDLTNTVLSLGQDRLWRRATRALSLSLLTHAPFLAGHRCSSLPVPFPFPECAGSQVASGK